MSISIYPPIQACASVEECQDEQFTGGDIARMGEQAYMDYAGYLFHHFASCPQYKNDL